MMEQDSGRGLRQPALVSDGAPTGLHPSGFDPARVAEELSPSQREALIAFCSRKNSPWGYYATDLGASGAACAALERKGLLMGGLFPGDRTRSYRWTNRGERVFDAIINSDRSESQDA